MGLNIWTRSLPFILGLIVIAAGVLAYLSWRDKSAEDVTGEYYSVAKGDVVSSVLLTGKAEPGSLTQVTTPQAGGITWRVESGSKVESGQTLAEVNYPVSSGSFTSGVDQTRLHEADLKVYAATLNYNSDPSDNNLRLLNEAQAERRRVLATRTFTPSSTSNTMVELKAALAGQLTFDPNLKSVTKNQVVGQISGSSWAVVVPIAEKDLSNVIGKTVLVSQGGKLHEGQISGIHDGRLDLNLKDNAVLVTGDVQIEVVFDVKKDVIAVPKNAVVFKDDKWWVKKAETKSTSEITIGTIGNDYVEVTSGLNEGELIEPEIGVTSDNS